MSQLLLPNNFPQTLSLSATQSPTGQALTLTWVDQLTAGGGGGGYVSDPSVSGDFRSSLPVVALMTATAMSAFFNFGNTGPGSPWYLYAQDSEGDQLVQGYGTPQATAVTGAIWDGLYTATEISAVSPVSVDPFNSGVGTFRGFEALPIAIFATGAACASGYFASTGDADAIAAGLTSLRFYPAATPPNKAVALAEASDNIDRGMRFQGRKYDPTQLTEFPRVAYDSSKRLTLGLGLGPVGPIGPEGPEVFGLGVEIWDWDYTSGNAIVPVPVLKAVVMQADWILGSVNQQERLDAIHTGLKGQRTGNLSSDYDRNAPGVRSGICRRSWQMLQRYRLSTGRII